MSDKKAEGFNEWYYPDGEGRPNRFHSPPHRSAYYRCLVTWNYLTEKHDKEILDKCETILTVTKLLNAANEKLELLTKCDCNRHDREFNPCQGCKNKQLVDNEFSGGE